MLSMLAASNPASDVSFEYDLLGRLAGATETINGMPYATSYAYDASGNLTEKADSNGTTTYTWNARGKLILGETSDGKSSECRYNALNVRVWNGQTRENENAGYATPTRRSITARNIYGTTCRR
jgi:YD repeat-containing protein